MRTHNFAKHLAIALAKPATEAVVTEPVPADAVVVPEVVVAATEAAVVATEDLTPNHIEVEPKDPESPIEPNQVPAPGATAAVADPCPTPDILEQPDHQDGDGKIAAESATPIDGVQPAVEAAVSALSVTGIDTNTGLILSKEAWFGKSAPKEAEKTEYQKMEENKEYHGLAKIHDANAKDPDEIKKDASWLGIPGVTHGGHYHELVASQFRKMADQHHAATESASVSEPAAPAAASAEPAAAAAPTTENVEAEAVIAAPGSGTETVEVDEVPHGVENSLIACHDICHRMDDNIDEAEGLHDATAALEAILNAIGEEPNGITGGGAKYVHLAVEQITNKWEGQVSIVPSIESFGGEISRREATLTLESNVKEIIKQVIAYLKNLWAQFVNLLKKFYQHITNGVGFLEHKAKAIKAKAEHIEGAPREAEMEIDETLAARIAANGKVMNIAEMGAIVDKILSGESEESEEVAQANQAANTAIVSLFTADESNFDERLAAVDEVQKKAGTVAGGMFTEDGGKRTIELPGGVSYEIKAGDTISFAKHHHEGEVAAVKIATLPKESIIQAAAQAAASAVKVRHGLAAINALEKQAHSMFDAMKDNANINESQAKKLASAMTRWKMNTSNMIRMLADILIDVVKAESAALNIAEKAISLYGAKPLHEKVGEVAGNVANNAANAVAPAAAVALHGAGLVADGVKNTVNAGIDAAAHVAQAVAGKN